MSFIVDRRLNGRHKSTINRQRFLKRYREHIREAVNDAVNQRSIRDMERGERIVMTNGCFDLLHPGHVAYLAEARALGDRLLVAVNDDASVRCLKVPDRPVNPLASRLQLLAALRSVDWVVPFAGDTPAALIEAIGPDVLVKGGDYRLEQIAGHQAVLARGGQVQVMPFLPGHSSSALLARIRGGQVGER